MVFDVLMFEIVKTISIALKITDDSSSSLEGEWFIKAANELDLVIPLLLPSDDFSLLILCKDSVLNINCSLNILKGLFGTQELIAKLIMF